MLLPGAAEILAFVAAVPAILHAVRESETFTRHPEQRAVWLLLLWLHRSGYSTTSSRGKPAAAAQQAPRPKPSPELAAEALEAVRSVLREGDSSLGLAHALALVGHLNVAATVLRPLLLNDQAAKPIVEELDAFRARTRSSAAEAAAACASAEAAADGKQLAADGLEKVSELSQRAMSSLKDLMGALRAPGKGD